MKRILFIHHQFPDEGASGKVVFLRHLKNLGPECEIHIAVPQNLKNLQPLDYPPNFVIHYIPLRKFYWPPFRESSSLLISLRVFLLKFVLIKLISSVRPSTIISVLNSYLAITAAITAKRSNIPFLLFVHDRWELFVDSPALRKTRHELSLNALRIASKLFPVSESLIDTTDPFLQEKTILLYPIPQLVENKAEWRDSLSQSIKVIHVGTINHYAVRIFEYIAQSLSATDRLELVYVEMDFLEEPLKKNKNIRIVPFFPKATDAINYVKESASALLVNYGLSEEENPFSTASFPSRFVEFAQAGVPIICITHETSYFYTFLKKNNWILLFDNKNIGDLPLFLERLKEKAFWTKCAEQTKNVAEKSFNPVTIQNIFENEIY